MGQAACSDRLAGRHGLAGDHIDRIEKRIAGPQSPTVVDGHRQVVDDQAGKRHGPAEYRPNRRPHGNQVVNPPVPTEPVPRRKSGDDGTIHGRTGTHRSRENHQGKGQKHRHPAQCKEARASCLDVPQVDRGHVLADGRRPMADSRFRQLTRR